MATIVHNDFRNAQFGNPTHSVVDFDTDAIASSLLDQTDSGTITAAFVDYDEVDAPTVVAGEVAHTSKTVGTVGVGIYDAADTTFVAVSGDAADYLTVHKDTGTPATSPLCVTYDSATTGLPVTPNGSNIDVVWNASGIVQI